MNRKYAAVVFLDETNAFNMIKEIGFCFRGA